MEKDTALQRERTLARVKRYRERQKSVTKGSVTTDNVTPRYDHDLTVGEILKLHNERTRDQLDRFPEIPLPFGKAYYDILSSQT